MTQTEQPLSLNPLVGYDAHDCRHEDGHNTLNGIEPSYPASETGLRKIAALARQIRSPHCELQETEQNQLEFLNFHILLFFNHQTS